MTKAQIETLTALFERFVEAHEAIAEAMVITATPNIVSGGGASALPEVISGDDEPAPETGEDTASDLFSIGEQAAATAEEPAPAAEDPTSFLDEGSSDAPGLDLNDKKAVEAFTATLRTLLGEFGKAKSPEEALALIEEVTGNAKFSECPPDKLEELHDAVYDALEE